MDPSTNYLFFLSLFSTGSSNQAVCLNLPQWLFLAILQNCEELLMRIYASHFTNKKTVELWPILNLGITPKLGIKKVKYIYVSHLHSDDLGCTTLDSCAPRPKGEVWPLPSTTDDRDLGYELGLRLDALLPTTSWGRGSQSDHLYRKANEQ